MVRHHLEVGHLKSWGGTPPDQSVLGTDVRAEGLSRGYGRTQALAGVSFAPQPGVTVLLGPNGAGKSTLTRLLLGVEFPDSGQVLRGGRSVTAGEVLREHHRRSGWLPQAFGYPTGMRVQDFLCYAAWLKEVPRGSRTALVEHALERVLLSDQRRRRLGQLSGGMLRRVGIAQAIVHQPDFVVLDEPTAGLDPEQRDYFHRTVAQVGRAATVVISTHLLEDVAVLAEHTVVLDDGRVLFDGHVDRLVARGEGPDTVSRIRSAFVGLLAEARAGTG